MGSPCFPSEWNRLFVPWQPLPVGCGTAADAVLLRPVEDGFAQQVEQHRQVVLPVGFPQEFLQPLVKQFLGYIHEERTDVELHHVAVLGVVLRTFADKSLHPADAVQCPFLFPGAVTVVYKFRFQQRLYLAGDQVVYHPVAEVGGEHLALHRLEYNEGDRAGRLVGSSVNFTPQPDALPLIVRLEGKGVMRPPFFAAAGEVSLKDFFQTDAARLFGGE